MEFNEAYYWLKQGEKRQQFIMALTQPLTTKQLAAKMSMDEDSCRYVLWQLRLYRLVGCLNYKAQRSRLYWLTETGQECRRRLFEKAGKDYEELILPNIDWDLYGWILYSHRSAIIKVLDKPMQPAAIKRKALFANPQLQMSANNVRDVIKLFNQKDVVQKVKVRRKVHPRYELTDLGKQLKEMLLNI